MESRETAKAILEQTQELRERAEESGLDTLAYLLALAEAEASDRARDLMPDCKPKKRGE